MTELVGFKELTPYKGGWCGNEIFPNAFTEEIRNKARTYTKQFGDQLYKEGYKGYFELDFLIDKDTNSLYLGELNPRITGISNLTNNAKFAHLDVPLFLFHLLEWMDVNYEIDVDVLSKRWSSEAYMDSWSQLIIKHVPKTVELTLEAPASGIWEMKKNGNIEYKSSDNQRTSITQDNQAFFMRLTDTNDYMYEGVDLGILILQGRLMTDAFQLTERAKKWISAIHSNFKSQIVDASKLTQEELDELLKVRLK